MLGRTLNLGITAHVDAGKTTLTERLLYAAGVIDEVGSVDAGTTQTDSLSLEQQRGITIRSAVVSFPIDDLTVNLIDTPGHPDFIAEVERVLSVLDGAVLVISAVEGVQSQTRLLMRALQRLRIPTVVFVNKIDRRGAQYGHVLDDISEKLTAAVVAMGSVCDLGMRAAGFAPFGATDSAFVAKLASVLADHDDALLADYVEDETSVPFGRLGEALAVQTKRAIVHPVFFGSALTGAGVESLMRGIAELLPAADCDIARAMSGRVFKIERGAAGDKIAYVRMFSGTLRTGDRLRFGEGVERKVTGISVFDHGSSVRRRSVAAGEIAKLWGMSEVRIGDAIGELRSNAARQFAPPTFETVVVPRRPQDKGAVRAALAQLAEQDPLINVRQDDRRKEIAVSLYGEVQKEVLQATLANDFGLDVGFRETSIVCVERPAGTGEAVELLHAESNPFLATVGLRVAPAAAGSGVDFRLEVDRHSVPMYLYKTTANFTDSMGEYVRDALQEGLFGWRVTDCTVTMTRCTYSSPDGPPATRGPLSTASDFRKLTPLVFRQALERAGTVVCEPVDRFRLDLPADTLGPVLSALARLRAGVEAPSTRGSWCMLEGRIPAARVQALRRQLPALTRGEAVLESTFDRYEPVSGAAPKRPQRA